MSDWNLEPSWPLQSALDQGVYFYLEAIEHADGLVSARGRVGMIMLGSYSYLGLNGHPKINAAAEDALRRFGTGTHGTRLLAGTLAIHEHLEERIAKFKGTQAAVTFSSGYFANVSTIACLLRPGDTVVCDKLDHASIVDGCRLSGATVVRFRHNNMAHLEECLRGSGAQGRTLVVVDAVFSMDGDIVNLPDVSRLCRQYEAFLMVDEAHSVGVLGRTGHGIEEHFGLPADCIDLKMGTFSKAIPSTGGYVAASETLCAFLRHQSRGFIYSGALPAASAAASIAALDVIEDEPERITTLHDNAAYFAKRLRETGLSSSRFGTPIFPIVCGDNWKAWKLARHCQLNGVFVQGIPHPVVPKGTARLRVAVSSLHRQPLLNKAIEVLLQGAANLGGIIID